MTTPGGEVSRPLSSAADAPKSRRIDGAEWLRRYGFLLALLLPAIVLLIADERFRSVQNLSNVLAQTSIVGISAVGMAIVMILGGFDLSIGSIAALAGLVAVVLFHNGALPYMILGSLAAVLCGAGVGLVNGVLISQIGINPLIATLAMASIARGVVLIVSEGTIYRAQGDAEAITNIALGRWHMFPIAGFFFLATVALGWFALNKMRFGHYVYAIGGSETAARLSGVPVRRIVMGGYALMGAFAGLSGLLLLARTGTALTNAGTGLELEAITATVIGGTRLGGGAGTIGGTVLGVLLLGVIRNGLNLNGVSPFWQPFIIGCILLATVVISRSSRSRSRSGLG